MSLKQVVVTGCAIVVLGVAGYFGANAVITHQIRAGIDQSLTKLPAGITAKYASVSYSLIDDTVSVTGISVVSPARFGGFTLRLDQVDIIHGSTGFADRWAQLSANPASVTPDVVLPIADEIDLSGIAVVAAQSSASIANSQIKGIRLHPWALLRPEVPGWFAETRALPLSILGLGGKPTPAQTLAVLNPVLRLGAAWVLALDYDQVTESHLRETAHIDAARPARTMDLAVSIDQITQPQGFHQGLIGSTLQSGIEESDRGQFDLKVARVNVGLADVRDAAMKLVTGAPLTPDLLDNLKIGGMMATGIAAQTPAGGSISIGDLGVDSLGFANGVADAGHFAIEELRLRDADLAIIPRATEAMRMLGLHTLTLSIGMGYRWNLDRQTFTLDRTMVKIDELGSLTLDADLGGVALPRNLADLPPTVVLDQATLRYSDASLLNRVLTATAAMRGIDPETLRLSLIAMIQSRGAVLGDSPAATSLPTALAAFVQSPGTLTVSATPTTPVKLAALESLQALDPADIVHLLGLSASANR